MVCRLLVLYTARPNYCSVTGFHLSTAILYPPSAMSNQEKTEIRGREGTPGKSPMNEHTCGHTCFNRGCFRSSEAMSPFLTKDTHPQPFKFSGQQGESEDAHPSIPTAGNCR